MKRAWKLAPPAIAALLLLASAPAGAQSAGAGAGMSDLQQMEQFAPMLEMMKRRMGKQRFARLMQTVGPMMDQMMTGSGGYGAGSFGAFGGGQTVDIAQMASLIDGPTIDALVGAFAPVERPRSGRRSARRTER
jgi:hypothetical protein